MYNKKTFKLIIAVLFISCSVLFAQTVERVLNIQESINTGLNNNQELLILKEQIALAQQRVNEARALIYPKIDFNFSASEFVNDLPVVLSPSFNSIYLPNDDNRHYSTQFTLWQYLYSAGRYTNNLRLAETNLSQTQSNAEAVVNRIIREVKKSFYNLVAIKEKIKLHNKIINNINSDIQKYPNKSDSLTADLENFRSDLIILKHNYEKSELEFLNIIGLELNTKIDIEGKLIPPNEEFDLNKCLAWASQFRPELRRTQFQEAIDSLRVNLSLAERFPTITMGAAYEWAGHQFPLQKRNWSATLNLNVPVFDGWASWSRIKQRKFQKREGQIQRAQIQDQIRLEVRKALLDYDFWVKQMEEIDKHDYAANNKLRLRKEIKRIDTIHKALHSQFDIEWAIGKYLKESYHFIPTNNRAP